jgi:uncharacterized protein (TIGR02266 family)
MSAEENRQRRRFRRRTVRVEVDYSFEGGARREIATTLGAGGLFIETEDPLYQGAALKLAFSLPGSSVRHVIHGVVVWAHEPAVAARGSCGMGIAFKDRAGIAALARELKDLPD